MQTWNYNLINVCSWDMKYHIWDVRLVENRIDKKSWETKNQNFSTAWPKKYKTVLEFEDIIDALFQVFQS